MTRALQVPIWASPLDGTSLTDVFAEVVGFEINLIDQSYTITVRLFMSESAKTAGRSRLAKIRFADRDGVFPAWTDAFADTNFSVPLNNLRNWMYDTLKANDARFAGASDIT